MNNALFSGCNWSGVEIECWTIQLRLNRERERAAIAALPSDGRVRARRLPRVRRVQYLWGREIARSMVGRALGVAPSSVAIEVGPDRKPRAVVNVDLDLSIAHSGDRVCVAVSREGPVGIDVETSPLPSWETIDRFFTRAEGGWLRSLDHERRSYAYRALWSIKEARAKVDGGGLRFPLPEVAVPLRCCDAAEGHSWRIVDDGGIPVALAMKSGSSEVHPLDVPLTDAPRSDFASTVLERLLSKEAARSALRN